MIHIEAIGDADFVKNILRKMAPPLGAFSIARPSCSSSIGRC